MEPKKRQRYRLADATEATLTEALTLTITALADAQKSAHDAHTQSKQLKAPNTQRTTERVITHLKALQAALTTLSRNHPHT